MQLTFRNTHRQDRDGGWVGANAINLADGSVVSILQWSNREGLSLDEEQKVSFHIIVAVFVLTHLFDTALWMVGGTGAQQNEEAGA